MAKKYKDDHKMEEDKAKEDITEKLGNAAPKLHGVTVCMNNISTFSDETT